MLELLRCVGIQILAAIAWSIIAAIQKQGEEQNNGTHKGKRGGGEEIP